MNFRQKTALAAAGFSLGFFNFGLYFLNKILFRGLSVAPRKILVYKLGNIGDVICAVPAFVTIRQNYPQAEIVLLSSPGRWGAPGAAELLKHAGYFNRQRIYFGDEISSWSGIKNLWRELRKEKFNLFIQLPDDWANFRTLARNMIFARLIGAKKAVGFVLRTSDLFKKIQVDCSPLQKNEVESLLDVIRRSGLKTGGITFDFGDVSEEKAAAAGLLKRTFGILPEKLIGLNLGAKRPANEWGDGNFRKIAGWLQREKGCSLVFFGGEKDRVRNDSVIKSLPHPEKAVNAAGEADLLVTRELMNLCLFVISNDTGAAHLSASIGRSVIGIYNIRNVLGKWFPYGDQHKLLYHKSMDCDYRKEDCVKKSIDAVSVEEVETACGNFLKNHG